MFIEEFFFKKLLRLKKSKLFNPWILNGQSTSGSARFAVPHWFSPLCIQSWWFHSNQFSASCKFVASIIGLKYTLKGTNISPKNGILKMIFLFPRWDMLVPWRVWLYHQLLDVWWSMWAKNKTPYQTYTLRQTNTAGRQIRILFLVNTIKMLVFFFHGYLGFSGVCFTYISWSGRPEEALKPWEPSDHHISDHRNTMTVFPTYQQKNTSLRIMKDAPMEGFFNQDDAGVYWSSMRNQFWGLRDS